MLRKNNKKGRESGNTRRRSKPKSDPDNIDRRLLEDDVCTRVHRDSWDSLWAMQGTRERILELATQAEESGLYADQFARNNSKLNASNRQDPSSSLGTRAIDTRLTRGK